MNLLDAGGARRRRGVGGGSRAADRGAPRVPGQAGRDARRRAGDVIRFLSTRAAVAHRRGRPGAARTRWPAVAVAPACWSSSGTSCSAGCRRARRPGPGGGAGRLDRGLRDTIAGAVGLEQAIPATARAAAPAIREHLHTMVDRLRARMPLPQALEHFADDMDDASADLVIAALMLNARLRGPGLREVLGALAKSSREEVDMRQRVMAQRSSTRRSVQIVVAVSVAVVLGLAVFNRSFVEPYGSVTGQMVLLLVIGLFAAGFFWLRKLSSIETPARFLRRARGARPLPFPSSGAVIRGDVRGAGRGAGRAGAVPAHQGSDAEQAGPDAGDRPDRRAAPATARPPSAGPGREAEGPGQAPPRPGHLGRRVLHPPGLADPLDPRRPGDPGPLGGAVPGHQAAAGGARRDLRAVRVRRLHGRRPAPDADRPGVAGAAFGAVFFVLPDLEVRDKAADETRGTSAACSPPTWTWWR